MRSKYLSLLLLILSSCQEPGKPEKQLHTTKATPAVLPVMQTQASAAPDKNDPDISGNYEQTDTTDGGCPISVTIRKSADGYRYKLTNDQKHYTGKIKLERDGDQSTGIIFEGIPYAEYEGDVSQLDDHGERPQPKLPIGVGGLLNGDTILIQNYGNAMNYYVQFGGCDAKFISLIKN
ncbi:hypothetical protein SAMN05216464_103218 [Mucilaginibacter pineti]|uniref:Lipoprotein n=1 Tax=Mucilaginibacter pineti TaxID=1391627 RepID=A0A1G6Z4I6_9SPHI|nr:hypothetical protein [Mucilaginibacter pineti]SDD97674.1 hypothetical protein SAMN05216464_103218 [Mucilaginibacter pineti]